MSYVRRYSGTIHGSESVSYNYPASQNGGSGTVTVHWQEPWEASVLVDTHPFDHSVQSLKHHVDALTGAVVATQSLQVAAKVASAQAVGQSVTDGFFTLIRSDITQQMAAVKSRIDSLLMNLNGLKAGVLQIREQMGQDYGRITERYARVFEDLDQETHNRVASLDEALIKAQKNIVGQLTRSTGKNTTAIATIFGGETSNSQATMLSAGIRQRMNQLLMNAKAFLASDKRLSQDFSAILTEDAKVGSRQVHLPALFLVADGPEGKPFEEVFTPSSELCPLGKEALHRELAARFKDKALSWTPMGPQPQVDRFLTVMVAGIQGGDPGHDTRVREAILKLWSARKPAILPF